LPNDDIKGEFGNKESLSGVEKDFEKFDDLPTYS